MQFSCLFLVIKIPGSQAGLTFCQRLTFSFDGIAFNILGIKILNKVCRKSMGENREFRSQQRIVWQNSIWNNLPLLTDSVVHKTYTATHLLPNPRLNHVLHLRFSQQIILPMHSGILQKHHIGLLTTLQVNTLSLHLSLPFSRHSSVLSFSKRYIKVTRVLKGSGAKQNSTIFAIAKQKAHNHMNSVVAESREFLLAKPLICDSWIFTLFFKSSN